MENSPVCEFYNCSKVFVTGGTGFLGKLLLEKLLRTCPNVSTIFLLMRPKKGKTEDERFEELFEGNVFYLLKETFPDYRKKVKIVSGDVGLPKLGLSEADYDLMAQEVDIVFHIAATVRFDEKLKTAVHINIRGTKHLLDLAKQMTKLKAFIHVSTAYANCPNKHIGEQFYPTPLSCDEIVQLVDSLQEDMLSKITPTLLGEWPNTYAYTKAIAEDTVREFGENLPISVVRPAVVISTAKEPFPGWINNVYGPTGVVVGAGLGLLRTMHCDKDILAEIVPADMNPISWGEYMKFNECGKEYPSLRVLWYYSFRLNKYRIIHNLCTIFLHLLPALLVDTGLRIMGKKPMLWNAYKKIHRFVDVISYFSTQKWTFSNNNVQEMWNRLDPIDQKHFEFDIGALEWPSVFRVSMENLRMNFANETPDTLEEARKRYRRLKIAHYTLVYSLWLLFFAALTWVFINILHLDEPVLDLGTSEILEVFQGTHIFVTGTAGFLGQVLVEKLLRTCEVDKLYLLVKSEENKTEQECLENLFQGKLYERLIREQPYCLEKIVLVPGDCEKQGLGLSDEDRNMIINKINLIFCSDSLVGFNDKIKTAVNVNILATKTVLDIAKQMSHLKAFVYISTAYSNCREKEIDEKFYRPPLKWYELVHLVEALDQNTLEIIMPRVMQDWPNTYLFTKALAEDLIKDEGEGLPIGILRPSLVVNTALEPVTGWTNNIFGAAGVVAGAAEGLLKTLHCKKDKNADMVPADMCVNAAIAIAWQLEKKRVALETYDSNICIFNYVSTPQNPISWESFMNYNEYAISYPFSISIWYYCFTLNKHRFIHNIMWNTYKKIHEFMDTIAYFTTQEWIFHNKNVQILWKELNPRDRKLFFFDISTLEWEVFLSYMLKGLKYYFGDEGFDKLDQLTKQNKR
ncbi:hypothetical protein C0J52_10393 [Blattella germanica]|nr:hypothetical protein C0J52_10393 [Blattella germanica]